MKNNLILCLFMMAFTAMSAQVSVGTSTGLDKWRVGGGVGISTGSNSYFGLNISPYVGYMVSPKLEAGLATGYQYSSSDYFKSNILTVGPYLNYYIIDNFFARSRYEYLTGSQDMKNSNYSFDIDESALWLGAGYQSTGRIRYQVGLMYNVLYDEDESIYNNGLRPFGGIAVSL